MGIASSTVKLHLELWKRGFYEGMNSVMDLGAQEIYMPFMDFENLIEAAGPKDYQKEEFANLMGFPSRPYCSSKPLYRLLGFQEYAAIDMNGEHDSIAFDLNYPFEDQDHHGRYDLVTDYGTNEHVFNVGETYRTMHRLCKVGGLIHIEQAIFGGNGYWNYDVSVFESLAAANNYETVYAAFFIHTGSAGSFHIPLSRELITYFDFSKIPSNRLTGPLFGVSYVFRKQLSDEFRYPYQYNLQGVDGRVQGYLLQFIPQVPSRTLVPMIDLDRVATKTLVKTAVKKIVRRARRSIRI